MKDYFSIKWTLYIALASLFICVSLTDMGPFSTVVKNMVFSSHLQEPSHKYIVMFDGGSTGTRVHVYTFVRNSSGLFNLKNEYYEEVKPGLSNFANDPRYATVNVLNLLEKAKALVPSDSWDDTPVVLKATAGLRLLPKHLSDSILNEISETFKGSPFISDEKSVAILDGEDEGRYGWFTLNFLLGRLDELNHSVAALDLGGGSTQVTFFPIEFDTLIFSPKEYIVNMKVRNKTMSLYTHSYLGLGLMSARLSILKLNDNKDHKTDGKAVTFSTSCLPPGVKVIWKHDQNEFIVYGSKDDNYGYEYCYDRAVKFLSNIVDQPGELSKREIYATSYYFERAVDLGLINENSGGISTVGDFDDACKLVCKKEKPGKWFLCLDCSYISALLKHGLGFNKNKEIMFVNQIDGIDTSWGLGAVFSLFPNVHLV